MQQGYLSFDRAMIHPCVNCDDDVTLLPGFRRADNPEAPCLARLH